MQPPGLARGRVLASAGDLHGAVEAYEKGLAEEPESAELYQALGEALNELRQYGRAAAALERALALAPGERTLLALVAARSGDGKLDEAAMLMEQQVQASPTPANQVRLGLLRLAQDRLADAIALFDAALRAAPDDLEAKGALGRAYTRAGRHDEAVRALEPVVKAYGASGATAASFLVALAQAYDALGRSDDAIRSYRQAATRDPNNVEAAASIGGMMRRAGEVEAAIEHLKALERKHASSALVQLELGLAYRDFHVDEQAIVSLERAVKLDPKLASAYPPLIDSLAGKEASTARFYRLLKAASSALPDDFSIQQRLGRAASDRKDYDLAVEVLTQAVKLQPNDADANYLLGMAEIGADLLDDARESLRALQVIDAQKAAALAKAIEEAEAKPREKPSGPAKGKKKRKARRKK